MATQSPPPFGSRLNLENQRNRARALLKAARARDPEALRRFTADPRVRVSRDFSLHHAQLVIAREHGFASWAKLKAHVDAASFVLVALLDAANRALETDAKNALYCDPLARPLAGEVGIALHNATRTMTWPPNTQGAAPELSILTRYFDDALSDAVHRLSLRQVLILGAGTDTRAFRLQWPAGVRLFELDHEAILAPKEEALRKLRAQSTCDRRTVVADLRHSWRSKLVATGFDERRPAAVLLIGRLAFLDRPTVERVFRALRTICAPGSWIGLDFVSARSLKSTFLRPLLQKRAEFGYPPWQFGVNDPEGFLAERGWSSTCVVFGAPEASYGRWRYAYVPRSNPDPQIPRFYLAQGYMTPRGRP